MIVIQASSHPIGWMITATGHAEYAEHGQDIVCAGVSALLFGYLAYVCGCDGTSASLPADGLTPGRDGRGWIIHTSGDGSLKIYTIGMDGADKAAWEVTAAGLSLLAQQYPANIQLDITEKGDTHGS